MARHFFTGLRLSPERREEGTERREEGTERRDTGGKNASLRSQRWIALLITMFLLLTAAFSYSADWHVDPAANYRIDWTGGSWKGVTAPRMEWYLADGLEWDTTGAGVYRNTGSGSLTAGLMDAVQPGLAEGALFAGQGALSLDGVNDCLAAGDDNQFDFGSGDFLVEMWLRTSTTAFLASWGRHIVGNHNMGAMGAWAVSINKDSNSGKLLFKGSDLSGYLWDLESASAVNDGRWHHVVAARDSSDALTGARLYVDGELDASGAQTGGSVNNDLGLAIGADVGGDNGQFEGEIALARLYKFNFTGSIDALVDSLYSARPGGSEDAPFPTAQAAVWAAASGDTVTLHPGSYAETVTVSESLTIAAAQAGFGFRPVLNGKGLPAAAGTVGLSTNSALCLTGCDFHGYASTSGGKGLEITEAANPSLLAYLTFDSCLTGISRVGDADGDTIRCCDFLGRGMAGSKGVVWSDGLATGAYEVVSTANLFLGLDTGMVCGAWAEPIFEGNDLFDVGKECEGFAPTGENYILPPRFRGRDYRPAARVLEGIGAWETRLERGRLMRAARRDR